MKLTIDVGNTLAKLGVFDQEELVHVEKTDQLTIDSIRQLCNQYNDIQSVILCSVQGPDPQLSSYLQDRFHFVALDHRTPLPVNIDYNTPQTLGADRVAAVVAANQLYPDSHVLVIESGTCITYDFIDEQGIYQGGSISPGMDLRFRSLHNFTANLPLVRAGAETALTGKSTEESIRSGVMNGLIAEMTGIISMYERNYENLTIILSGGNLEYFDKYLKNNIFAVPNIVLKGLNKILDFNAKN